MYKPLPEPSDASVHGYYICGSLLCAVIAALGMYIDSRVLYAMVPGVLGAAMAAFACYRFARQKVDLAGLVATTSGFIFYQAFQANPATLAEFSAGLASIEPVDKVTGIFLGNFTSGMLLIAYGVVSRMMKGPIDALVPSAPAAARETMDGRVFAGFLVVLAVVAFPNIVFGRVIVGAIDNILYQRAAWSETGEFSGFETGGGAVAGSLVNMIFWSTSLFFLWLYLLGSRYRALMWVLSPLVLLWTASVAFQGSRTYLVTMGFGFIFYLCGSPKFGNRGITYSLVAAAGVFLALQVSSLFRTEGLSSFDVQDLRSHLFEVHGNEGTSSQMDGLEFFRTEYVAKEAAPNPIVGLFKGLLERPIEGILIPLPRSVFPWKPTDETAAEFTVYYQNVRLGYNSTEAFMGASPGLMGRELIRYGYLGPLTVLFWLGLVLALADRLYASAPASDFHRIFATVLVAFFVAEMRDWVPLWFLPFLPAMVLLGFLARGAVTSARTAR